MDEIYDYVTYREKSDNLAIKLTNEIFDRVEQLKTFPESGQPELLLVEIGQDSRYLVEGSYKIIYEYHPVHATIIITDVFHTSRNPVKMRNHH